MAELYTRPRTNFYKNEEIQDVGTGPDKEMSIVLYYETPGWIAFDFATQIAHNAVGELTDARFEFYVDQVKRFQARGPYTFTRVYIYVDKGEHVFTWQNNGDFGAEDWSKVRAINGTAFELVHDFVAIDRESPPKALQKINPMETLNGYNRYQQGSPGGVEIDFQLTFAPKREPGEHGQVLSAYDHFANFMDKFPNFYILKYNYGLFGGAILQPTPANKGPLTFLECTLHSPMKSKNDLEVW